ncbi:hypothetical protein [Achromobacter sp. SLBN-14]|uniref:hypothetical protein n=1 Tax=Achromobacter sp. SLBN-14 TaxID=2768442 RepID=UPI00114DF9DB|nr:hypothetical protein [Achromobacter sp. SLBN-14]TQJ97288.1 hypothetical protein FBY20_4083 [Achromobacter sp. SLBN-14]
MSEDWHPQETYKSMISISTEGFKLLALLNGGAAAGMLAAFPHLSKSIPPFALQISIACFAIGLVFVGVAFLAAYATQNALYNESMKRPMPKSHVVYLKRAFRACVFSLVFFLGGALTAVFSIDAERHQQSHSEGAEAAPAEFTGP